MVPAFNIYNQEKLLGALAGVRAQVRVRVGVEVRVVVGVEFRDAYLQAQSWHIGSLISSTLCHMYQ